MLRAADEIRLTAQVTTSGAGTVYIMSGGNMDINRQVTSASGDILLQAGANLSVDSVIQSTSGDIGLVVAGDLTQTADIITGGGVFVDAGGNVTMSSSTKIDAGGDLTIDSGASITLGLLDATRVSLRAAQNIVDSNAATANVRATDLSMLAGGSIGNLNAIDLEVGTVAARAVTVSIWKNWQSVAIWLWGMWSRPMLQLTFVTCSSVVQRVRSY